MGGHTDSRNGDLCNVPWQATILDRVNINELYKHVNIHAIAIVNHNGKSLSCSISFASCSEVSAFEAVQCRHVHNASTFSDFYFSLRKWFLRVGEKITVVIGTRLVLAIGVTASSFPHSASETGCRELAKVIAVVRPHLEARARKRRYSV